jgi:pimeloyl-ACP methyl ester carboxylesterase
MTGILKAGASALALAMSSLSVQAGDLDGLVQGDAAVNGVRLHYVVIGEGEPVLLLHGWPESLIAWRQVMPLLVKSGRRVWAIDLRGFGDSDKPASGYELDNVARDVHEFIRLQHLSTAEGGIDVVAHDIGSWVGHALAADYPADVRRLVLSEALLPAVAPATAGIPDEAANLRTWHFAFNRLEDLPELLVQGREREYLAFLFQTKAIRRWRIDGAAFDEYVRQFSVPGAARAGFAYYRVNYSIAGLAQARARATRRLPMPVLAIGASGGVGSALEKSLAPIAADVQGVILEECGHFLPDECPDEMVRAILGFWASRTR